jgi:hypothetical protein
MMRELLLQEVFRLLEEATRLEKDGQHRIEAATKYYESCYLLRQIVAAAEAKVPSEQSNDDDEQTIGASTRHLLENKIDHYTTIARKLYFEEGSVLVRPEKPQQEQQPATSVMIGLLDDAISVLTEIPTIPPPISVPVLGCTKEALASRRNLPKATAPVTSSENHHQPTEGNKRTTNNNNNNNIRRRQQQKKLQKHQPKQQIQQQSQWIRTPRNALAAIERRIHLRANVAHSTLSKAIDLDEKHLNGNQTRANVIATYVEASELYLGAIQMGEDQKNKLDARRRNTPSTSSSSAALVQTMEGCLNGLLAKLKRLLVSALDRIEALKNEEEQQKQKSFFVQPHFTASTSMTTSILSMPIASKVPESFPFQHWFRAKENINNNCTVKREEKSSSKAPDHRGQSPTTVVW